MATIEKLTPQQIEAMRGNLRNLIIDWLNSDNFQFRWKAVAWLGDNLENHMADAVLAALLASHDVQLYMQREELLAKEAA